MIPHPIHTGRKLSFFVPGLPRPAGSKRAFPIKRAGIFTGRVAVVDDNPKSKDWKCAVSNAAAGAVKMSASSDWAPPFQGPVVLRLRFAMPYLKAHYNSKGLKPNAPKAPEVKPDVLKLARAVEDALTGIVWRDDAQVVEEVLGKRYGLTPGVLIQIEDWTEEPNQTPKEPCDNQSLMSLPT